MALEGSLGTGRAHQQIAPAAIQPSLSLLLLVTRQGNTVGQPCSEENEIGNWMGLEMLQDGHGIRVKKCTKAPYGLTTIGNECFSSVLTGALYTALGVLLYMQKQIFDVINVTRVNQS